MTVSPPARALLRVALLSVEECARAVDSGDVSTIDLLDKGLTLAGDFVAYRDKMARYDDVVLRYVSRMGGRATPFGIFAGAAPLAIGRHRRLELGRRDQHVAHVRIDVGALQDALRDAVAAHPETVPYLVNPTVRRHAGRLRYSKPGNSTAAIVEIKDTAALSAVVGLLKDSSLSAAQVAEKLAPRPQDRPALVSFVRQLADRELLLPDIGLLFHGSEPLELARDSLRAMGATDYLAAIERLHELAAGAWPLPEFRDLDLDGPWQDAAATVPAFSDIPVAQRFHVDLELAAPEATIEASTVSALQAAVEKLIELFPPDDALAAFKDAFRLRYEDTRAPLLEALDPDLGVLPASKRRNSQLAGAAEPRRADDDARLRVPEAAVRASALGQHMSTVDLLLEPSAQHRPAGLRHPARVLQATLLDRYEGRYGAHLLAAYRHGSIGPLARFALSQPALVEDPVGAGERLDSEEDGPIVAEVLFGPVGRYGNIVMRPRLHRDSIALFGARRGTIGLDELDISLAGDEVVLWHRPSGRPVLLDLNTAHNVLAHHNSPIYTFLARVRDWGACMWDWAGLGQAALLPRVTCGSVILSPRRWLVPYEDVVRVLDDPRPAVRLRAVLPGFADRRWLGFGQDDNVLTVDTYSDRSVRTLLTRATGKKATAFIEMPAMEAPAVASDRGRHTAEVMIPVSVRRERRHPPILPPRFDPAAGRDWVYARYHCGPGAADQVVAQAAAMATALREDGTARQWFFVRYDDGFFHVRVRVRPSSLGCRPAVLAAMEALGHRLADAGLVSRTAFDTYVPEPGRFGGYPGLALAEELFDADSDTVAERLRGVPSESDRLDAGARDALAWSAVVSDGPQEQLRTLTIWRDGMGIGPTKRTGKVARERRIGIDDRLEAPPRVARCLAGYHDHLRAAPGRLQRQALGSAMHMHFNRLFETDARRLEWLAYELAVRALREQLARAGETAKSRAA